MITRDPPFQFVMCLRNYVYTNNKKIVVHKNHTNYIQFGLVECMSNVHGSHSTVNFFRFSFWSMSNYNFLRILIQHMYRGHLWSSACSKQQIVHNSICVCVVCTHKVKLNFILMQLIFSNCFSCDLFRQRMERTLLVLASQIRHNNVPIFCFRPPVRLYVQFNDVDDSFYAMNRIYDRNEVSLQKSYTARSIIYTRVIFITIFSRCKRHMVNLRSQ